MLRYPAILETWLYRPSKICHSDSFLTKKAAVETGLASFATADKCYKSCHPVSSVIDSWFRRLRRMVFIVSDIFQRLLVLMPIESLVITANTLGLGSPESLSCRGQFTWPRREHLVSRR